MNFLSKVILVVLLTLIPLSFVHASIDQVEDPIGQAEDEVEELFNKTHSLTVTQPTSKKEFFFHFLKKKLEENHHITSLNFIDIKLNTYGILFIEVMLDNNEFIEKLRLNNCNLSNDDLKDIVSGLEDNKTLKSIVFQKNPLITKEAQEDFKKAVVNKNITIEFDS